MSESLPGLGMFAALHQGAVAVRNGLFDKGRLKVERLPRPVISIGNVAVGGTGKTPFVEEVARLLSEEGYVACILSRGYRGARTHEPMIVSNFTRILHGPAESGDEPYLLAQHLPGVPVVVGADRVAAGRFALEHLPVHVFLLDDGFQHRQLHRDLDLALLDASDPWSGGALLPAGRLREPLTCLKRASAIGLTRADRIPTAGLQDIKNELAKIAPDVPVFTTRTRTIGLRTLPRGTTPVAALENLPVLAFAGIARPSSFFADLEGLGARIVARREFDDHHPYTREEVRALQDAAQSAGAAALVTTEKDSVRMSRLPLGELPIHAVRQRAVSDSPEALLRFIVAKIMTSTRS